MFNMMKEMEYNQKKIKKIANQKNLNVGKDGRHLRPIVVTALAASIMTTLPSTLVAHEAEAQQTTGINWGEICRNPIVDAVIVEPCSTLTTSGGYVLTDEGNRVIRCIGGGAVLLILDPSGQTLVAAQALGPAVGCGGGGGVPTGLPVSDVFAPSDQQGQSNDPLADILRTIFDLDQKSTFLYNHITDCRKS
jgi:hypothetical protein